MLHLPFQSRKETICEVKIENIRYLRIDCSSKQGTVANTMDKTNEVCSM